MLPSIKVRDRHEGFERRVPSASLKSMVNLGYLFYDNCNRIYMPTMRIAQMGSWLTTSLFGESSILDLVNFLNQEPDELVSISTQSDLHTPHIHCVQTRKFVRFDSRPGDVQPLAINGIGRTLLSAHTDVEIARLMRRINATGPPAERFELEPPRKIITGIRRHGYPFSKHTITPDAGVIAMPLPKRSFGRILVLGVGGPVPRLEDCHSQIVGCMREGIQRFLND